VAELIREHSTLVKTEDTIYIVRIYAEKRTVNTWAGWLEFHPTDKRKRVLRTGEETSQPSRATIEYWAYGLEPIYLEGALARAQGRLLHRFEHFDLVCCIKQSGSVGWFGNTALNGASSFTTRFVE
jgi:hypothetical protein